MSHLPQLDIGEEQANNENDNAMSDHGDHDDGSMPPAPIITPVSSVDDQSWRHRAIVVVAITLCIIADKVPKYRPIFTMAVLLIFGVIFCAISTAVTAPIPRYIFLCFINTAIWAGNPLALSYTSTVMGPLHPEVRAISLASINGMANLAQLYATEIFTVAKPPLAIMGFGIFAGFFAIGAMVYLASFFVYRKWPYKPTKLS